MEISLVGRPNVGKSSLFNALTGAGRALVAEVEGVTRDRKRQRLRWEGEEQSDLALNDLAGLEAESDGAGEDLASKVQNKTWSHLAQSHLLLFVVDGRAGLHPQDVDLARSLQRRLPHLPRLLVINKAEFLEPNGCQAEFFCLGMGEGLLVSAAHHQGLEVLLDGIRCQRFALLEGQSASARAPTLASEDSLVLLGRPNVGKSTLMNSLLGQERVVTDGRAGTTRESIVEEGHRGRLTFRLVDTAGIRPRSAIAADDKVEVGGVRQAFKSLGGAPMVLLVLDVRQGATHQDRLLLQRLLRLGKATLLVLNKADGWGPRQKREAWQAMQATLNFAPYLPGVVISAARGEGIEALWQGVTRLRKALNLQLPTAQLNRALQSLVERSPPPRIPSTQKRARLKYIHQQGGFPLRLNIIGNQLKALPGSYKKYIEHGLRQALALPTIPFQIHWQEGHNPFDKSET